MRAGPIFPLGDGVQIARSGAVFLMGVEYQDGPYTYGDMMNWCAENCVTDHHLGQIAAIFVSEDDAVAFRIRFA